ncbi:MAG: hypothetical protein DRG63_06260 [Deltaproteobacteria bacterium]|nr:MAG: hypothetical protein DRG63_06260 [Deltaproteobacteria bacterium]
MDLGGPAILLFKETPDKQKDGALDFFVVLSQGSLPFMCIELNFCLISQLRDKANPVSGSRPILW